MAIKFVVNSRIEILDDTEVYKSIIQDESSENLTISLPIKNGVFMTPANGQTLELLYYDNLNVYKFESLVLGRQIENNVPQLLLSFPQNVVKIQRRKFVRVDVAFYIKYARFSVEEGSNISLQKEVQAAYQGILLDISGGGFRLNTTHKLQLKDIVVTEIPTENGSIKTIGEVVRVEKQPDGKYYCGISFSNIDERTRDRIIQYIFTLMRKQRKNI
jgi:c-di-GMP-binding flagellar brake protein YcgR